MQSEEGSHRTASRKRLWSSAGQARPAPVVQKQRCSEGRLHWNARGPDILHGCNCGTALVRNSASEDRGPFNASEEQLTNNRGPIEADGPAVADAIGSRPQTPPMGRGENLENVLERLPGWYFAGEEEADYTDGPPRMIAVTNGSKRMPAILPDWELSKKLQAAALAEGELRYELQRAKDQLRVIQNFRQDFMARLQRLMDLRDEHYRMPGMDAIVNEYNRQINALHSESRRAEEDEALIKRRTIEVEKRTSVAQSIAAAALEDLFIDCELFEDEPEAFPRTDWDLQFEKGFIGAEDSSDRDRGAPSEVLDADRAGSETARSRASIHPDPRAEARIEARDVYDETRAEFQLAQRNFATRDYFRFQREPESSNVSNHPFVKDRKLTRRLVEAEEAFREAKEKAFGLGVELALSDRTSGFPDQSEDGLGSGVFAPEYIDRTPVQRWLDGSRTPLPADQAGDEADHEMEDWDCRSVDISDSASAVAEGSERRRIDKWKSACDALASSNDGPPGQVA